MPQSYEMLLQVANKESKLAFFPNESSIMLETFVYKLKALYYFLQEMSLSVVTLHANDYVRKASIEAI